MPTDLPPPASAGGGAHRSFADRLMGALRLDPSLYAEVGHDSGALRQAAIVVVLASAAAAAPALPAAADVLVEPLPGLAGSVLAGLLNWVGSTVIVWAVAARLGHVAGYGALLRPLGFAAAPQLFLVLHLTVVGGLVVTLGVLLWDVAANVVAIRQVLAVPTRRALFIFGVAYMLRTLALLGLFMAAGGAELIGAG